MTFTPIAIDPSVIEYYAPRIARGVAWLDKRFPDWAERIDMETLDMSDPNNCIIGQLAPTSYAIFVYGESVDTYRLGFDGMYISDSQPLWEREILARL